MKLSGALLAGLLASVAAVGWAEEGDKDQRISLSITNGDVHDALAMIAQQSGLNISVDSKVRGTVTASLVDISPAEALRVIAGAVGARVRDDNGVYVVEPKPLPAERPRTAPAGAGGALVVPPGGATAGATAAGASTAGSVAVGDGEVIRVIKLKYADPALIAAAFGGTVIGSSGMLGGSPFHQGGGRGGRNGSRGGYGGYGSSGGYGGSGGRSGSSGWRGADSLYSGGGSRGGAWGYGGY